MTCFIARSALTKTLVASAVMMTTALVALSACTPKPGNSCKSEGVAACANPSTQLVCKNGVYVSYPCKGPLGCRGKDATCNLSGNAANDPCSSKVEGKKLCSADHKQRLRCEKSKVEVERCDGVGGCTATDTSVDCNRDEPVIGEVCGEHFDDQCSRDRKSTFHCEKERWIAGRPCRGPKGCDPGGPTCDVTVALAGDPCGSGEEAHSTCSVDGRSVLRCDSGRFKIESACPTGKTCTFPKPEKAWEHPHNEVYYGTSVVRLSMNAICQ